MQKWEAQFFCLFNFFQTLFGKFWETCLLWRPWRCWHTASENRLFFHILLSGNTLGLSCFFTSFLTRYNNVFSFSRLNLTFRYCDHCSCSVCLKHRIHIFLFVCSSSYCIHNLVPEGLFPVLRECSYPHWDHHMYTLFWRRVQFLDWL